MLHSEHFNISFLSFPRLLAQLGWVGHAHLSLNTILPSVSFSRAPAAPLVSLCTICTPHLLRSSSCSPSYHRDPFALSLSPPSVSFRLKTCLSQSYSWIIRTTCTLITYTLFFLAILISVTLVLCSIFLSVTPQPYPHSSLLISPLSYEIYRLTWLKSFYRAQNTRRYSPLQSSTLNSLRSHDLFCHNKRKCTNL